MTKVKNAGGRKVSITHTLIIWTGILLAIFGALVAALGLGGVTTFTFKWKDIIELNSTSVGIVIMITGVVLAWYQANHLPKGVGVLMKH
ncbi:MAG: hypothetical protein PHE48_00175 [Candidatus Daviesbacteria bacterium]|nr:hypothetical protein [Candidatus Daviesbacteria bacterium]